MTDKDNEIERVRVLKYNPSTRQMIIRNEEGDLGIVSPLKVGTPLQPQQDLVHFRATDEPDVLDVKTIYRGSGPPKASTPSYREGWDRTFDEKPRKEDLN